MALTVKTSEEILQDYSAKILATYGVSPLSDPANNKPSPLVNLVKFTSDSLSDVQRAVQKVLLEQDPNNLSGLDLQRYAIARGITPKTGSKSKATVMITGEVGTTLESGSQFTDSCGGIWELEKDVRLYEVGRGCAYGQGIVCSQDPINYVLDANELRYDNTLTPWVYSATNGVQLSVGGAEESDQELRDRILNRLPMANVIGTVDNAINSIEAISGVNFVRYINEPTCIGDGPMFIVHGGTDCSICNEILIKGGQVCNLIGDVECDDCSNVRFQRPCPILICIEVELNECPISPESEITELIMSIAGQLARLTRIRAADIVRVHPDINNVRLRIKEPLLTGCPETDAPRYTDPLDGSDIIFGTSNPNGLCRGVSECENDDNPWSSVVRIQQYQYAIIDESQITYVNEQPLTVQCVECN